MRKIRSFIMILFVIMTVLVCGVHAKAASATVDFTTSSTVVSKGNNLTVSMIVEAGAAFSEFEGTISYDPDVLEFLDSSSAITGGDGILRVSDTNSADSTTKKKYSMKFRAKSVGVSEITLTESPMLYEDVSGSAMSVSINRLTINVKTTKRVSTDTRLEALRISPGTLTPAFDSGLNEYTVKVSEDVKDLIISATAKDTKASVKVSGNRGLIPGENVVTVTVIAESGDTRDIKLYVTKPEALPVPDGATDVFKVYQEGVKVYIENAYRYQVVEVPEGAEVPVGYEKTKLSLYGVDVTAYTKKDDLDNDFLLIYAMNQNGEMSFYQYDRVEKTLQRYTGLTEASTSNNHANSMGVDEYRNKLNQLSIVIAVLSGLCALLTIGIIKFYLKSRGYKEDSDEDMEE